MGIRELREELRSPSGWAGQATALIGRQWKLEDATISALVEQKKAQSAATQDMLKTRFTETSGIVNELAKALQEDPSNPTLNTRFDTQVGNLARAEAAWMSTLGYTPQQVISESEVIFGLIDQIDKDPGAFAEKGTWNKSTLDLITKKFEQLGMSPPNPDVAEALWKGRIAAEGLKGTALPGQLGGGSTQLLNRYSMAGIAAEVLGTVPDFLSEAYEGAAELSRSIWEGKNYMTPLESPRDWGDRTSREFLRKTFGVESDVQRAERLDRPDVERITPTGDSIKMGPFAILDRFTGTDAGLINGFLAQPESPTVTNLDSSMIGESAFQELQALDEEARDELSREARNFLTMLQTYIDQYGRDRAIRLLSGEYTSLSDADKRAIEKALTQR